jgi:hypothetical protein
MHEIQSCEEALQKAQHIEIDDDWSSTSTSMEKILEEKLEMLQQSLKNMIVRRSDLWCSTCLNEGHTKYYCKYNDAPEREPECSSSAGKIYYEICQSLKNHNTRDFPHNLRNAKPKWCVIYEESNHLTQECQLNGWKKKKSMQYIIHKQPTRMWNKEIKDEEMAIKVEMAIKEEVATKDMEVIEEDIMEGMEEADMVVVKEGIIVLPIGKMIISTLTTHLKKELTSSFVTYVE